MQRLLVSTVFACLATSASASERLPDGGIARAENGAVRLAWYAEPTDRYAHAVLGDAIEAGALVLALSDGQEITYLLNRDLVFEDITPRLADLDGDGRAEAVTILSSTRRGAALAVVDVDAANRATLRRTPVIGRTNRWLNVAGIADFDGDGRVEIAIVKTPHLGGALEFWRYGDAGLEQVASLSGFSNHALGSRDLELSALLPNDGTAVDLLVPAAGRMSVRHVGFREGRATIVAEYPLLARADANFQSRIDGAVTVPLANGESYIIAKP